LVAPPSAADLIPNVKALATLADVRDLVELHLLAERRARNTWRYVATLPAGAARREDEPGVVEIAVRLVLAMEGVECRQS
jgi:hypothetical protein